MCAVIRYHLRHMVRPLHESFVSAIEVDSVRVETAEQAIGGGPAISVLDAPKRRVPSCRQHMIRSSRIDMVAIDIDGTLLRSDKKLHRDVRDAVRGVCDRGKHVVLATARPPRSVKAIAEYLGLDTPSIHYNGALIHHRVRKQHLHHLPLETRLGKQIIRYARRIDPSVTVSVEILDKWYTDQVEDTLVTETSKTFAPDHIGPLESFWHIPATKIMFLAPPEKLGKVKAAIASRFGKHISLVVCDAHLIQIINRRADKGAALKHLADLHGIRQENVMAIGDAPNDAGMIRWAGLGVAMGNAWPDVKNHADFIAPSNDNHGVADTLRQFML